MAGKKKRKGGSKKAAAKGTSQPPAQAPEAAPPAGEVRAQVGPPGTISVCMMVKNEEKNLPRALESVKPWVDEIIVVDTGSTDRTVEIAKSYGAKVYHHPWENDFSKHRNQSISYATGDWLLILDADEELDQETAPQIRKLTTAPPEIGAFLFELYNDVVAGGKTFVLHPRLFRNGVGFHYQGKVHNRPVVPGAVARSSVRLIHYGYNETPEVMEAKHQRRLTMIRAWVEEEPDNFLAHSYLAHSLLSRPESVPEAVEEALEALRLLRQTKGDEQRYPHVYFPIVNGLTTLGRDDELLQHAADCLEVAPYYPDPLFFMVWVEYKRQAWEDLCAHAARFWELQQRCRENPQDYIFFENMTYDQLNTVLMRWVVAAGRLGRDEEAARVMGMVLQERGGEEASKGAVLTLLNAGRPDLAQRLAEQVSREKPEWAWPANVLRLCTRQSGEQEARQMVARAKEDLAAGREEAALQGLRQAAELNPLDPDAQLTLARALETAGREAEAKTALMRGLSAHPGHAWAWQRLAEICFRQGDHAGAAACYRRYLQQEPGDQSAQGRLEVCSRRLEGAPPTVAQQPPRLVVFLVGGLTPELVRLPAPHLLMGTAWGEFLASPGPQPSAPNWATLYTGAPPEVHGLAGEASFGQALSVAGLQVPAFWEVLGPEVRVGLVAAPLTFPPPRVNGWCLAGFPAGLLSPEAVHPPELAARVLATGYRTDFALSEFELQTAPQRLESDVRQEALLYQAERHKLSTAATLPAVDLLVVGLSALDYLQQARELATYQMFGAYQQVYGWIESFLAGVQPQAFAVFSQRGYPRQGTEPERGGFYCLSWLRGENGKANITDVAAEVVKYLGGDPARLGRPRG